MIKDTNTPDLFRAFEQGAHDADMPWGYCNRYPVGDPRHEAYKKGYERAMEYPWGFK